MTTATFSVSYSDDDYETNILSTSPNYPTARELDSSFQVEIRPSTESVLVFYGLSAIYDDFDISVSYSPLHVPLLKGTDYTFTVNVINNGEDYEGAITLLYVDGSLLSSKLTNINGDSVYVLRFTSIGTHSLTIKVYKTPTNEVYDEDFSYLVIEGAEITEEEGVSIFGETLLESALNLLPVAVIVLVPAGYGSEVGGTMGFIVGALIGLSICIGGGLLPVYYLYLIALALIMAFILVIRSGGGNKE